MTEDNVPKSHCFVDTCRWRGHTCEFPYHFNTIHPKRVLNSLNLLIDMQQTGPRVFIYVMGQLIFRVTVMVFGKQAFRIVILLEGKMDWEKYVVFELSSKYLADKGLTVSFPSSECNYQAVIFGKIEIARDFVKFGTSLKIHPAVLMELEWIEKRLQCPTCGITMAPPVFICSKGHILCYDCAGYMSICNICCSSVLTNIQNFDNQSLELQIPCVHSCGIRTGSTLIRQHEVLCRKRKLRCPHCGWKGIWTDYEIHYQSNNCPDIVFTEDVDVTLVHGKLKQFYYYGLLTIATVRRESGYFVLTVSYKGPPCLRYQTNYVVKAFNTYFAPTVTRPAADCLKHIYLIPEAIDAVNVAIKFDSGGWSDTGDENE